METVFLGLDKGLRNAGVVGTIYFDIPPKQPWDWIPEKRQPYLEITAEGKDNSDA